MLHRYLAGIISIMSSQTPRQFNMTEQILVTYVLSPPYPAVSVTPKQVTTIIRGTPARKQHVE